MEQNTETLTNDTQAEESQLNSAAGEVAESVATGDSNSADSLSLAEINEITGMSYKDKETALKSIKDMKSQAGKAADLEGKLKALNSDNTNGQNDAAIKALEEKLNQTQLEVFYSKNPDVNKELAETIAKANGIGIQEAVESELYKNVVAKQPEKRTVAASNSRVAQSTGEQFNPADHAGDATALAKYVTDTYLK